MEALHLAGAFALLLSFGLLCQLRVGPAAWICAVQAAVVAVAMATQGIAAGAFPVVLAGVLAFALNGVALPFALHRHADSPAPASAMATGWSVGASLAAAAVLVAISLMLSTRLDIGSRGEVIALALSIMLLGLLRMAMGSDRAAASLGLLASQNGALLAAAAILDLPPLALLAAALPVVPALVTAFAWLHTPDGASP